VKIEKHYRPELPPVPRRMQTLPIRRGYPVPWFVAIVDDDYHFPTADARKLKLALAKRLCWVCGQKLGTHFAFVIGPMCAINYNTSEPPSHRDCAVFSAIACPFLARPHMKRRTEMPEGATNPAGIFLDRNPGVACVWVTRQFWKRPVAGGLLFKIGKPEEVLWFAEGRAATRGEVLASIDSGYPILHQVAVDEGADAVLELQEAYTRALELVPSIVGPGERAA
jgi:hypothetical protein